MSDPDSTGRPADEDHQVEHPDLVTPGDGDDGDGDDGAEGERPRGPSIEEPAKVMRVGSMIKQLLEEVRSSPLDEPSRDRLRDIYETSITELAEALSPDLQEELSRMALPFDEATPSESELRVAQAQLVGWLEGLFHGIQATLFAQQAAAQRQLQEVRGQLTPGQGGPQGVPGRGREDSGADRPGTYL